MTFSHLTRHPCTLLMVAFIGVASYGQAARQAQPAAPAAARSGVVQPVAPMSPTPAARVGAARTDLRMALPSDALLGLPASTLTEPVLVIPGKPMDPQAIDQAVEDLSIMSRILGKTVAGEDHAGNMAGFTVGTDLFIATPGHTTATPGLLFPAIGRPKPMYLGGYGALFFMQVDFPLLPPPQTPQEQPANSQEDPVWADARRSVLEGEARLDPAHEEGETQEPYSREQVEALRTALITMMKHATNIRALEPAEWVTIVVQGPAPTAAAGRSILTLRASKANVDQYAKGQLNQQQFEQRLQVSSH